MKTVLIACTGNTCRSPMAAALLENMLSKAGISGVAVVSRGFAAHDGEPASREAQLAMSRRGLDISAHRAARLTDAELAAADMVLVMDEARRRSAAARCGDAGKARVICPGGVADPFGGGADVYEACAQQMERCLARLLPLIREL